MEPRKWWTKTLHWFSCLKASSLWEKIHRMAEGKCWLCKHKDRSPDSHTHVTSSYVSPQQEGMSVGTSQELTCQPVRDCPPKKVESNRRKHQELTSGLLVCTHSTHINTSKVLRSTTSSCQRQPTVLVKLSPLRIWKARFLYCQQSRKTRQQDLNEVFCPVLVSEFIWSTHMAAIETSGNFAFLEMFRCLPCLHTCSPLHISTHLLHGTHIFPLLLQLCFSA